MGSALLVAKIYPDPVDAGLRVPPPTGEARYGELPVLTSRARELLWIVNDSRLKRGAW
jgi:hypothetical protein